MLSEWDTIHLPALIAQHFGVSISEAKRCLNRGSVRLDGRQILDWDLPRKMVSGKELKLGRRRGIQIGPAALNWVGTPENPVVVVIEKPLGLGAEES